VLKNWDGVAGVEKWTTVSGVTEEARGGSFFVLVLKRDSTRAQNGLHLHLTTNVSMFSTSQRNNNLTERDKNMNAILSILVPTAVDMLLCVIMWLKAVILLSMSWKNCESDATVDTCKCSQTLPKSDYLKGS